MSVFIYLFRQPLTCIFVYNQIVHAVHAVRRAWNRLPTELKLLRSTDSFCRDFCFILSMGTRIRIDSVIRPRSSSRGRNTSASVTVTVNFRRFGLLFSKFLRCHSRNLAVTRFGVAFAALNTSTNLLCVEANE